ncbi:hypothetical protein DASC09_042740 [Saccharomycopsis crataegensis]|uniref:Protein arginine methyltransferase NDUFAF7 n=1 Tax=Saccharomycopsis crataegensis TaxID=43959 RepID=A0AAV5QQG1_9ASCO|nr:hypothetical protein DASC09_042740 [Saccharomycopsis crataegensis]
MKRLQKSPFSRQFIRNITGKPTLQNSSTATSNKPPAYEPDFSITQTTYSYQLPVANELESDIRVSASPISLLFEYTGVETSTANYSKNQEAFETYPLTTFKKLSAKYANLIKKQQEISRRSNAQIAIERPRNLKLTCKDFIDDSLYNPSYGYFNKDVEIFHLDKPFDYRGIASTDEFIDVWMEHYSKYNQHRSNGLQLWHTPSELFQPYYGQAVANFMVNQYKSKIQPKGKNMVIYEIGAGNGTLMQNVLDHLKATEPEIYENVEYRIIEISNKLYHKQVSNKVHESKIKLINKDIFQWNELVEDEVFFLAFEVFDNFAHDVLKYNIRTKLPYQGYVVIDKHNEFKEFFNPKLDYWTHFFLDLRSKTSYQQKLDSRFAVQKWLDPKSPADELEELNEFRNYCWPFRNKLTWSSEFIPTKLLEFFTILNKYFPNHHLLATDFSRFDGAVEPSYNGPVVQTLFLANDKLENDTRIAKPRAPNPMATSVVNKKDGDDKVDKKLEYKVSLIPKDKMVNTSTYMVHQGYFDIMFPTNFPLVTELYELVTGKKASHCGHGNFLQQHSKNLDMTTCKNGENPMLEFYKNVEFMYTK